MLTLRHTERLELLFQRSVVTSHQREVTVVKVHGSPRTARDLAAHPSRFAGFRANGSHHRLQATRLRRLLADGKRAQTGLLSKALRRSRGAPEPYR